ncbi:MAG: ABC transporter permease [Kiritimatiellae bacterium]|nr:ABC transporter permease [Kiritimatiellia bacterium]
MIPSLVLKSIRSGKARFLCAIAGVATAVSLFVFTSSLSKTASEQAPILAQKAVKPYVAWSNAPQTQKSDLALQVVRMSVDYRPGGRVLQGPPMRVVVANAPESNPYDSYEFLSGRWLDNKSPELEIVATRSAMKRFGRGEGIKLGEKVRLVGLKGVIEARLVGYIDGPKLPFVLPNVFANKAAFDKLLSEKIEVVSLWKTLPKDANKIETPNDEQVVRRYISDEQRKMDYARPLMFIASILTALALLVNSLLISVEANRRNLSILRMVGLTRFGVVKFVFVESFVSVAFGLVIGFLLAIFSLWLYVRAFPSDFPAGLTFDYSKGIMVVLLTPIIAIIASIVAMRPALLVRPLESISNLESAGRIKRSFGMAIAFSLGFAAFVAVEVWGASLMRGFVPSPEWPDAIVSLLPSGTSAHDVEKLRSINGVKRVSELYPLQLYFREENGANKKSNEPSRFGQRNMRSNALFLAAEWLPKFVFSEGSYEECQKAIKANDGACVISLMLARAKNLHKGDLLEVAVGGSRGRGDLEYVKLPIVGVVDVNWHMVTSRGLVRGLNGAPPMTDGPVFVSFDTIESLDSRPSSFVKMTHLWLEYEEEFLSSRGVFKAGREIEEEIRKRLSKDDAFTVRLHARDEIADGTLARGTNVIGQAARIPFIFLAILSIGFIAMLVAEADATRRQMAVLRAIGCTRVEIAFRLVKSAISTAIVGVVAGMPIGALAGWYFATRTASMWKGMPNYFVFPWQIILEGAVGGVLFALVIAIPASFIIVCSTKKV